MKQEIRNALTTIINDEGLEKTDITFTDLCSKGNSIGYSIRVFNSVWFRIKTNMKDKYRLEINNTNDSYSKIIQYNNLSHLVFTNKNGFIEVDTAKDIDLLLNIIYDLKHLLLDIYKYLDENEAVDPFGCCSRYVECCNNKRCIHPDKRHAKGCIYKKNLDSGRIFYGVNRNID